MNRSSGPLASSWAKWRRAKVHLDSLDAVFRQRVQADPEAFYRVAKTFDEKAGLFLFRIAEVRVTDEDRRDWGTVFGDCLNNLRAALDHLAWHLVMTGAKGSTLNDEQKVKVQFPIDAEGDDQKFKARCENWIPGIDTMFRDVCRMHQPYKSGNQTLAHLASLVGKDKHRVVTPLLVRNNAITFNPVPGSFVNCTYKSLQPASRSDRLEPDTPLAFVFVEPTGVGQPDMKMRIEMVGGLRLEEGLWVTDFLGAAANLTAAILEDFQRLL